MNIELRIARPLYEAILADLRRPHPFAAERIGFAFAKLDVVGSERRVLFASYSSISDELYVDDDRVGACLGEEAMAKAMADVYEAGEFGQGIFHVHVHEHRGPTAMSRTDEGGMPPMFPGFQAISGNVAHGILIFSEDHAAAWVWLPDELERTTVTAVTIIGAPISIYKENTPW